MFFLVLATNLIDKDNLAKVEQSVETIYEEILMTKNKVMEMSDLIHEKEVAYLMNDSLYYGIKGPSVN